MTDPHEASLSGRVALVTGGVSGIGRAVVESLAGLGATVVINSRSSSHAGEHLASSLPGARYQQADVTDPEQVRRLMEAISRDLGGLDIVVNSAGTSTAQPVAHRDLDGISEDDWTRVLRTNVVGPWNVTRAATPMLSRSEDGVVVNVSSLAGSRIGGSSIPYAVSKAALDHLTRLLASALAPEIRVNAVAPGLTDTPWSAGWDDARSAYRAKAPLQRIGDPEDVADACLSLVGLRHVTGEVLFVDGGRHLS